MEFQARYIAALHQLLNQQLYPHGLIPLQGQPGLLPPTGLALPAQVLQSMTPSVPRVLRPNDLPAPLALTGVGTPPAALNTSFAGQSLDGRLVCKPGSGSPYVWLDHSQQATPPIRAKVLGLLACNRGVYMSVADIASTFRRLDPMSSSSGSSVSRAIEELRRDYGCGIVQQHDGLYSIGMVDDALHPMPQDTKHNGPPLHAGPTTLFPSAPADNKTLPALELRQQCEPLTTDKRLQFNPWTGDFYLDRNCITLGSVQGPLVRRLAKGPITRADLAIHLYSDCKGSAKYKLQNCLDGLKDRFGPDFIRENKSTQTLTIGHPRRDGRPDESTGVSGDGPVQVPSGDQRPRKRLRSGSDSFAATTGIISGAETASRDGHGGQDGDLPLVPQLLLDLLESDTGPALAQGAPDDLSHGAGQGLGAPDASDWEDLSFKLPQLK